MELIFEWTINRVAYELYILFFWFFFAFSPISLPIAGAFFLNLFNNKTSMMSVSLIFFLSLRRRLLSTQKSRCIEWNIFKRKTWHFDHSMRICFISSTNKWIIVSQRNWSCCSTTRKIIRSFVTNVVMTFVNKKESEIR